MSRRRRRRDFFFAYSADFHENPSFLPVNLQVKIQVNLEVNFENLPVGISKRKRSVRDTRSNLLTHQGATTKVWMANNEEGLCGSPDTRGLPKKVGVGPV